MWRIFAIIGAFTVSAAIVIAAFMILISLGGTPVLVLIVFAILGFGWSAREESNLEDHQRRMNDKHRSRYSED